MPDVYVDSFVMTVQKNKVEDYQKFGERMAAPAKEHGALEYVNLASDDVKPRRKTYLPQAVKLYDNVLAHAARCIAGPWPDWRSAGL